MWLFYVMSLLPLVVGAILWFFVEDICWWEWLVGFAAGLLLSVLFHCFAVMGMIHDTETWSGQINQVVFYPRWVEEYQESHTRTVTHTNSKGEEEDEEETYYTTEYRTHYQYWKAFSTLDTDKEITQNTYNQFVRELGGKIDAHWEFKSGFDNGDHNIYVTTNTSGFVRPITEEKSFENRVKAAPTLFSFSKPPVDAKIFKYPDNDDWFSSDRLMGTAKIYIDLLEFDRLNARLGGTKKVNIILIGFPSGTDAMYGQWQQAAFIGGKKNDLVICFAGGSTVTKPEWVYVFGWTEQEIVKQNIQSILLDKNVNGGILPLIENEVRANYVIKNWHKFDYISVQPPTWSYVVYFIVLIVTQVFYWIWAYNQDEGKSVLFGRFEA